MSVIAVQLLVGERQRGESDNAVLACNDWLRLGAGRTIPKLLEYYQKLSANISNFEPPSAKYKTLNTWSSRYDWPSRAQGYDADWEERKNAARQAEFNDGLSLDYERVQRLKRLADFLEQQIYQTNEEGKYPNVWLHDVKSVGSGENAERVDLERFNPALLSEFRAVLDDIAKEVGGRIKKAELTGKDGTSIPISITKMDLDEL